MATIRFVRTKTHAILPKKAHEFDACYDLYSAEEVYMRPGDTHVVDTGFKIALPFAHVGLVCSRSGLAANSGLFVMNAPGVIDAGYRGALKVILHNASGTSRYIEQGDRIGQLMIQKMLKTSVEEVEEFEDDTARGTKGFGSTGR